MRTNSVVLIYVLILKSSPHMFPNNLQQLSVLVCFWHLPCHCQDVETPRAVDCGPCSAQTNLLSDGKNCSASWGFSLSLSVCQCLFLVAAEFTMSTTLTRMDRMDLSHFRTFAYPLQHLATLQPKHPACADLRDASLSSCSGTTWHTSMSQKSSLPFRRFWRQGHLIPPQAAWSSATLHHVRNVIVSRCRGMQAASFRDVCFVLRQARQAPFRVHLRSKHRMAEHRSHPTRQRVDSQYRVCFVCFVIVIWWETAILMRSELRILWAFFHQSIHQIMLHCEPCCELTKPTRLVDISQSIAFAQQGESQMEQQRVAKLRSGCI